MRFDDHDVITLGATYNPQHPATLLGNRLI
jgi:hypothetical protein